jgi:hypothetical protein
MQFDLYGSESNPGHSDPFILKSESITLAVRYICDLTVNFQSDPQYKNKRNLQKAHFKVNL